MKTDALKLDRDVLVARSNVGLGNFDLVLSEVKDSAATPVALRAVRVLAAYLHPDLPKAKALNALDSLIADSSANANVQYVAAVVRMHEGAFSDALRLVKDAATLEQYVRYRYVRCHSYFLFWCACFLHARLWKLEVKDGATLPSLMFVSGLLSAFNFCCASIAPTSLRRS